MSHALQLRGAEGPLDLLAAMLRPPLLPHGRPGNLPGDPGGLEGGQVRHQEIGRRSTLKYHLMLLCHSTAYFLFCYRSRPCPQSMAVGLTGARGASALSAAAVDSRSRSASAPTRTPSTEAGGARATTPRRGSATRSTAEVKARSLSV